MHFRESWCHEYFFASLAEIPNPKVSYCTGGDRSVLPKNKKMESWGWLWFKKRFKNKIKIFRSRPLHPLPLPRISPGPHVHVFSYVCTYLYWKLQLCFSVVEGEWGAVGLCVRAKLSSLIQINTFSWKLSLVGFWYSIVCTGLLAMVIFRAFIRFPSMKFYFMSFQRVQALFDFNSQDSEELEFKKGDIILGQFWFCLLLATSLARWIFIPTVWISVAARY